MDKFEQQLETTDVVTTTVEQTMGQATSLSTPEDEVNSLMAQVADEYNLDLKSQLQATVSSQKIKDPVQEVQTEDLLKQFEKLKAEKL